MNPAERLPVVPSVPLVPAAPDDPQTFYAQVGGHPTFAKLVHEFYVGVAADQPLRALYPEQDLGPAQDRLLGFLEQYWGGPSTYSEQRGHPRLRMRHMPFKVTPAQRDRWLLHMMNAVDTLGLEESHDLLLRDYLTRAAYSLVNSHDEE